MPTTNYSINIKGEFLKSFLSFVSCKHHLRLTVIKFFLKKQVIFITSLTYNKESSNINVFSLIFIYLSKTIWT